MANYNAIKQHEEDADSNHSLSPPLQHEARNDEPEGLFLDHEHENNLNSHDDDADHHQHASDNDTGLAGLVMKKVRERSTSKNSYDMLENDDFTAPMSPAEPAFPAADPHSPNAHKQSRQPAPIQTRATEDTFSLVDLAKAMQSSLSDGSRSAGPKSPVERTVSPEPMMRSASGRNIKLRHPSPGLQSLQGAYVGNIVNLEKSAERLSMTSDIAESIRRMSTELKKSDSRRSSILAATVEAIDIPTRQFSNNSIVEMNSAARNGGYSPGGFMMSPRSSMSGPIATRSVSKSSKYSRPEPEQEGRPLDSIVTVPAPDRSPKNSLMEDSTTFTRDVMAAGGMDEERPTTSASNNTYDQAQRMFMDFDGVHCPPSSRGPSTNPAEQRASIVAANRFSAQPQSYADPASGQQMVYYPAPVPTMLNLPQKLSKNGNASARDKRRSQVMSSLPPQARQSAIWLPDVLETEQDTHEESLENMEYMPQHQRRSMGGRRTMNDLENMPSQLRASTYFEYPSVPQNFDLKGESVTAALDSILDASTHAPVSAFTDHSYAHVGKEVYGREPLKNNKSTSNLLSPPTTDASKKKEKRRSSFLGLVRRSSSADLLDTKEKENRKSKISLSGSRQPRLSGEEDEDDEAQADTLLDDTDGIHVHADEEGQFDDEVYTGAPTTLLAELQLRKQQQKARTRPLTDVYANGVHSTLLEMEAVAQVQQKARQKKHVNLAWEGGIGAHEEEDDDVPLGLLYGANPAANAAPTMHRGVQRPIGLLESKHLEENEPLSRRRERLTGRPGIRASSMLALPNLIDEEEEGETLAERVKRLKAAGGTATGLPTARPISGDFASEMMSQLGVEAADTDKGKGKESPVVGEEEETLGQRRKRLQAEKEAREAEIESGMLGAVLGAAGGEKEERPTMVKRNSLADILKENPVGAHRTSTGVVPLLSQEKGRATGLLGAHERKEMRRASTMAGLQKDNNRISRAVSGDGGEHMRNKDVKVGGLLGMRDEMRHSSLGLGVAPNMGMGVNPNARHSTMSFATQNAFAGPYGNQAAMRSTMSFGPQTTVGMGYGQQMYGQPAYAQPAYGQQMYGGQAYAGNMYGGQMYGQPMYAGQMYGYPQQQMMPTGMQTGGVITDDKGKDMVERWRQSIMP